MPCSCMIPMPDFPTNCEWGPIIWRIIHGISLKYGNLMSPTYAKEQITFWINFIKQTLNILPCKECKEHYKQYLTKHNPNIIKTLSSEQQKLWVQNFFFNLHNEINLRNNKPLFEFNLLESTYKNVNYTFEIKHYEKLLNVIFQYNEVTMLSWLNWIRSFRSIAGIYGVS